MIKKAYTCLAVTLMLTTASPMLAPAISAQAASYTGAEQTSVISAAAPAKFATRNGKTYYSDLNASYNIGARYYIREILKSLPETARLDIEAKVPQCTRRSTCTLSTLFNLNAAMTVSAV